MNISQKQIKKFQQEILEWYAKNQRNFPWRQTRDPYKILVSEVMSQQTQISRVVPKYLVWMEKFPTIESLANASTRDVLAAWSGLGYNRRALYLQKLAQQLVNGVWGMGDGKPSPQPSPWQAGRGRSRKNSISWPTTEEELMKLPGIGEYTARAILCFAFNKQIAVVDTNVRKVILVHFFSERGKRVEEPSTGSGKKVIDDKLLKQIAEQLLPKGRAYEWNQALMDYSSMVLKNQSQTLLRQGYGRVKQAHFKTSNRFYRGQVLRLLIAHTKETIDSLFAKIENNGITKEKFEQILQGMEKDGLVDIHKKTIVLAS